MKQCDLVIVGAGPSALTAAVYATREGINTLVVEKAVIGGLMATADKVDNYPGFSDGIDGMSLAQQFEDQARRFKSEIAFGEVTKISRGDDGIIVSIDTGDVQAEACLIASGASYRKLNIPGERKYYGKGVHYCATCDGAFYKNRKITVIGGANTAIQEAMYLTRFASHIDILVRSYVKASEALKDELNSFIDQGKITVLEGYSPNEIKGNGVTVTGVEAFRSDNQDDKKLIDCDGVFVFAGTTPNTEFLTDSGIAMDQSGCVIVDKDFQTNLPGIFASGDVRAGAAKQIVSAAGDGAVAALNIRKYLEA